MPIERLQLDDPAGVARREASEGLVPLDAFGRVWTVPTGFAPKYLRHVIPLLPLLQPIIGDLFKDADAGADTAAIVADAREKVDLDEIIRLFMSPENWQTVQDSLHGLVEDVFGPEQAAELLGMNPPLGIAEWVALGRTMLRAWGVGLGELWQRVSSSSPAGETSNTTSPPTPTPARKASGRRRAKPGSSA